MKRSPKLDALLPAFNKDTIKFLQNEKHKTAVNLIASIFSFILQLETSSFSLYIQIYILLPLIFVQCTFGSLLSIDLRLALYVNETKNCQQKDIYFTLKRSLLKFLST